MHHTFLPQLVSFLPATYLGFLAECLERPLPTRNRNQCAPGLPGCPLFGRRSEKSGSALQGRQKAPVRVTTRRCNWFRHEGCAPTPFDTNVDQTSRRRISSSSLVHHKRKSSTFLISQRSEILGMVLKGKPDSDTDIEGASGEAPQQLIYRKSTSYAPAHPPTHPPTHPSAHARTQPLTCKFPGGSARSTKPCAYFISRRFVGNSVRSSSVFNRVMATSQFLMRCDSSSTGGSASASLLLLVGARHISINININIYIFITCLST